MAVGVFVERWREGDGGYPRRVPEGRASTAGGSGPGNLSRGNYAGTNWQESGPVETVAIPVMVSEESG